MEELKAMVIRGDASGAEQKTREALDAGVEAASLLDGALIAGMDEVGERFSRGQFFVPQMLRAAKAMQSCMAHLRPHLTGQEAAGLGHVVIGTVKGDLHDIGKNLVAMMLEGGGFVITDLGVDVPPDRFVQMARETEADIVALSALLSTTMPSMAATLAALEEAGLRDGLKVMVGGAPVTDRYAKEIGADGYAADAGAAVARARALLGKE